jgi:hypothetical protein
MLPAISVDEQGQGMTRFMDRKAVASGVMLAAIASAVIIMVKNHEARPTVVSITQAAENPARPLVSPLVPEQQRSLAATEDVPDAAFLAQVEHKYRFLIAEVQEEHVDELRRRLLERESQLDGRARDRIDAGIGKLLPAGSFAYYQALKDSDL